MFIRRTTYRMAPGHDSPAGQRQFEKDLRALVEPEEITGLISTAHVPNDDGSWFVIAVWQDRKFADAEMPRIREAWASLSDRLAGPPTIEASSVSLVEY